jgi:hypothetical protein
MIGDHNRKMERRFKKQLQYAELEKTQQQQQH